MSRSDIKPEGIRKDKDLDRRERIARIRSLLLALAFLFAVALFEFFLPIETLVPPAAVSQRQEGDLRIHFLSVGQGDAAIVEFPTGDCLLIDAGDGSFSNTNKLIRYLKGLAPASLTLLVTHAELDHCGGMADILKKIDVDKLYLPVLASSQPFYRDMTAAAEEKNVPCETIARYGVIAFGEAYAVCIGPHVTDETDANDASALLFLHYGTTDVLFGGDISSAREQHLLHEYQLDPHIFDSGEYAVDLTAVDILKVSHHGSSTSSSREWLELLRPAVSVISCGIDNPYGHPSAEAISRLTACGSAVYRLDELGDVIAEIHPNGYTVIPQGREL